MTLAQQQPKPIMYVKAVVIFLMSSLLLSTAYARQPNFIVVFIDDMGYGDIGPFGSKINQTPHLERMASEGIKLTSFYASPVCTPSRAALMTGCYPKRVGLGRGSWGVVLFPKDTNGLNPDEITVAEVLKDAGYATGCFGKWHLGDQPEFMPNNQGFDTYYGIPYSNDMWPHHGNSVKWKNGVCPLPIMRNGEVVEIVENMDDQADLCKKFTDEALSFIRDHKEEPFFCYIPHAFVHNPRNARAEFLEKATTKGTKKLLEAEVEELDWSMGEIFKTLKELNLDKDTIVLFTSDNGPAGGSAGPLRGHKGQTWEGGMREPTIVWWPGKIPAGTVNDEVCSTMDILPTFASLAHGKVPTDRVIDGKDITSLLLNTPGATSPYQAFFYFAANRLDAVRSGKWTLNRAGELYDLDNDIGESKNVASEHAETVSKLKKYKKEMEKEMSRSIRKAGVVNNPKYIVSP